MSARAAWDYLAEPERYELDEEPRYSFDLERRDFFKLLGTGIVVCLVQQKSPAFQRTPREQGRGRGRGRGGFGRGMGRVPQELGAWLHLNEGGEITVFTGKVEIGQNARTSLTQAVAEELRLSPERIHLVMADTDLVPVDGGTAGSGTTPRMAPQLHRVGAAAREVLIDLAAKHLGMERNTLVVADGKVAHPPSKRSVTFGELAKNQQLKRTVVADAPAASPRQWKTAGMSVPKVEGHAIVTGGHQYASDIRRPNMLFGKVLRPPGLNATLVSADVKEAAAMSGITVVRDGNFIGVAAPTSHQAEQAIAAIRAEWKTVKGRSTSETVFADIKKTKGEGGNGGGLGGRGNANEGSVEEGLAAADHKLAATYTIAYIAHAPLEPRAAVAEWADGKLTVWTGTQMPFRVKSELSGAFGVPSQKVRVIVPDMGSGYGGKHSGESAVEAARLAKGAGKPVKLVWTREEEFTWAYFRPAGVIELNAGVSKDGTITAWSFENYNSGGSAIQPLYDIPNQRVAFHRTQYPLRQGSYRALAATANHFARESHIDDLAHAVKIHPLAFRLKNLDEPRLRAVLEAAAKQFDFANAPPPTPERGVGIACGSEKGSYVATCAEVSIDRSTGKVHVTRLVTAFECGAIVNPDHLKNQIEGAAMMGLGGALFEAIQFADDKILNPRFSHYRVPRFSDAPKIEVVLLDRKDRPSAGAGETPIVAVAPAIGNAIFQATGVRLRSMPMAPRGLKV